MTRALEDTIKATGERIAPIPGFSNYYASDRGRIYNAGGMEIQTHDTKKHRQCSLKGDDSKRRGVGVHRLVWSAFNGPIPRGMWISHKDGDKSNNALENLESPIDKL